MANPVVGFFDSVAVFVWIRGFIICRWTDDTEKTQAGQRDWGQSLFVKVPWDFFRCSKIGWCSAILFLEIFYFCVCFLFFKFTFVQLFGV